MANTGERSPQAQSDFSSNGANAIDSNESTTASQIHLNTNAKIGFVSDFDGDDIPSGATINGIKVIFRGNKVPSGKRLNVPVYLSSLELKNLEKDGRFEIEKVDQPKPKPKKKKAPKKEKADE